MNMHAPRAREKIEPRREIGYKRGKIGNRLFASCTRLVSYVSRFCGSYICDPRKIRETAAQTPLMDISEMRARSRPRASRDREDTRWKGEKGYVSKQLSRGSFSFSHSLQQTRIKKRDKKLNSQSFLVSHSLTLCRRPILLLFVASMF